MSTNNGKIIQLIKSAITGEKYDFLGQLDFSEILSFARKHKIVPLIYHGLVNCGFFDEAKNLMQEVLFYIQINEFQKLFLKEI
ncbi:MAG: hypothetical protein Q4B04_06695, partial [bacterium]|nr:hypothetical protein [bacterium]